MPPTERLKAPPSRVILNPVEQKEIVVAGPYAAMKMENGLYRKVMEEQEYHADVINQYAHVVAVPDKAVEQVDDYQWIEHEMILEVDDMCLVEHTLISQNTRVHDNKGFRSMMYHKSFAKVDGDQLIANCRWNILEPIEFGKPEHTDESGIIIPDTRSTSKTFARAKWISKSLKDQGIKEGDVLAFMPGLDYDFMFQDKTYYCVETDNILCSCDISEIT